MIPALRKARNILLATTAIVLSASGCISYFVPLALAGPLSDGDWLVVHFFEGRMRLFRISSPDEAIAVTATESRSMPVLSITPREQPWPPLPDRLQGPDAPGSDSYWETRIRIGGRREVGSFGGRWKLPLRLQVPPRLPAPAPTVLVSYVRLPVWLPAVMLLIAPALAVIRGPILQRRRRKRGLCINCGYDLRGTDGTEPPAWRRTGGLEARAVSHKLDIAASGSSDAGRRLSAPKCPECGTPI